MTARFSHSIAGDLIVVTISTDVSQRTYRLAAGEMKRFAWAVLADLDPDEVVACARPQRLSSIRAGARERGRAAKVANSALGYGDVKAALLRALFTGPKSALQLTTAINRGSDVVAARMAWMRDSGLARRVDGQTGRGTIAIYALTPAGVAAVEALPVATPGAQR